MKTNYLINRRRMVAFCLGTKLGPGYFMKLTSHEDLVRRLKIYFTCESTIAHHISPDEWAEEVAYLIHEDFSTFLYVSSDDPEFHGFLNYTIIGSVEFGDPRLYMTLTNAHGIHLKR